MIVIKSIVLLSGGLDSTVSLAKAVKNTQVVLALTFDYGQKSVKQEVSYAKKTAKFYKIPHKVIKLDWLAEITDSALVNKQNRIPHKNLGNKRSAHAVWVPNRNSIFISVAAAFAEKLNAKMIITGFNKEEAKTFPDNSQPYVELMNRTLKFSTQNKPKVLSYTQTLIKKDIVKLGMKLGAPFQYVYTCYEGKVKQCDKCESCVRFKKALGEVALEWIGKRKGH